MHIFLDDMLDVEQLWNEILRLDQPIRFAGIANKMGKLVAPRFREGLQQLLTEEELGGSIMKAVLRMKTREDYESKLGNTIHTFTLYEKVKRASIPLDTSKGYSLLMVSFDITASMNQSSWIKYCLLWNTVIWLPKRNNQTINRLFSWWAYIGKIRIETKMCIAYIDTIYAPYIIDAGILEWFALQISVRTLHQQMIP